jgi:DNA-binding transcriptional ArsR family regulator
MERSIEIDILQHHAAAAAKLLKVLGSQKRLLLLCRLYRGEKSVGELLKIVDFSQSSLSQHLACLRRHGLVKRRKDGTTVFYSLAEHPTRKLLSALCFMYKRRDDSFTSEAGICPSRP